MNIGVLDFETDPFRAGRIPSPFACGIYFADEQYHLFWGMDCDLRVVEFLHTLPRCVLYAHNGGKFDFFFLIEHAETGTIKVRNGRIFEMQIGRVTLRDSWPLMPFPLEHYRKTKIDYSIFEFPIREDRANKIRIQHYLFDDCKNLYDLLIGFHAIVGPKDTIGSAAFYQMRKLGIEIESLNETHDEVFRPYFFGGRVEAFAKGVFNGGKYDYFDINSAYPFAMLHNHPHGADYQHKRTLPKDKKLGQCFVKVFAESAGALPFRSADGGLCFPHDNNIYFATGWEIIAGLETGTIKIKNILDVWIPSRTITFGPFVEHFYDLRAKAKRDGDLIAYLAYKYLLNSGYGKFAQNPRDFKEYLLHPFGEYPNDQTWEWETDYGGISLWSRSNFDGFGFYDVATGASITGFQRAMLWRGIKRAKDCLYCDTDAILCRGADLEIGQKLGQWKHEGSANEACIAGKKLYALRGKFGDEKEKIASKGARLTYGEIKSLCNGKTVTWENQAPTFSATVGAHFVKRRITST